MKNFIDEPCFSVGIGIGIGIVLSLAFFAGFKVGKGSEILIFELELDKLKQKTESKLEMIFKDYTATNGNRRLPDELDFKHIVDNVFIIDESLQEKIVGLHKIYLNLISHGTDSSYFIEIMNTYGPFVGM